MILVEVGGGSRLGGGIRVVKVVVMLVVGINGGRN